MSMIGPTNQTIEEEKADARAKKEEEKAKKVEEKRLRDEDKLKSKVPKEAGATDEEERPMTASEPPVLDPIQSVEPIDPDDDDLQRPMLRTTLTEEIMLQAEEEKRTSMLAETVEFVSSTGNTGADNAGVAAPKPLDASDVAKRVFSAPVVDLSEQATVPIPSPEKSISTDIQPTTPPPTEPSAPSTKPAEVLHRRIVPPAATTETTVTGPLPAQKQPKSEGKVSSWLKNKLRRSSKPAKPESSKADTPESAGNEKGFVGGASLTAATSASKSSTNPSKDGSVREVAMVGKSLSTAPAPTSTSTTSPAEVTSAALPTDVASNDDDNDDDLYAASTQDKGPKHSTRSSSPVSSLSSDEGEHPRGRSQLRREVTGSDENGGEQEFEEARDHFETEQLAPPAPLKGTLGMASNSPVRDSKFSEDL